MTPNAEKIRIGRDEFWMVPADELPGYAISGNGMICIPIIKLDEHLVFPYNGQPENFDSFISSGAIRHSIDRERPYGPQAPIKVEDKPIGFTASQLHLYDELDMDSECLEVLKAHEWIEQVECIASDLLERVSQVEGPCSITRAKLRYGENWDCYILERAAVHFAEPLSRLWYAANLRSLYYVHRDDLRSGYLWAEYRFRLRIEADTLRGEKVQTGSAKAAEQTNATHSGLRNARFELMETFVPLVGTDKAAIECELQGLGNAEAVKRQWNRHLKKKRDT